MPINLLIPTNGPAVSPKSLPAVEVSGLYVHVPFCVHKCHYCDFYSITRQQPARMAEFVDLLLNEASLWTNASSVGGPTIRPVTIFFGGGTPTLLPLREMDRLLRGLHQRFDLSAVDEWTVEANPATVTGEYCDMLRRHGVNRLSFGAQSFDRNELAMLERHHNPDDVPRSIELARAAGFGRLNIDLIYAIPGQDLASWERSLEAALSLGLTHLSCYGLTYEPNTPMAVRKRLGHFTGSPEALELQMLHHTRRRLIAAGRMPYEISNYAAPGEECRHNLLYWRGGSYVALGPSGASHVEGVRFRNRPHLGEWERSVAGDELPATDVETLTPGQRAGELVMLMLRLSEGIQFEDFERRSGLDASRLFAEPLERLSGLGLIELGAWGFKLTEKGLDVADSVAGEFLAD